MDEALEKLKRNMNLQAMLDGHVNRYSEHSQKEWDEIWEKFRKETSQKKYRRSKWQKQKMN